MPKITNPNPPKIAREIMPRLLRRERAAAYLGISGGHFDLLRDRGDIPPPKQVSENVVAWDMADLDRHIDELPYAGGPNDDSNDLDRILGV
jgi:predicted DNA-binding transcriptional regulator AlpA